jgi:hypothetical protein
MWPFTNKAAAVQPEPTLASAVDPLATSLPAGTVKHLDVVCRETGLTREQVLALPGVHYAPINDQVTIPEVGKIPHRRFAKHVSAP